MEGCTFTAHEKIVEKHIQMQHSNGLYERLRKLETPEDIERWRMERKRNYPKKENIERRRNEQMEMIKSGAKIRKNTNRFGKDKFRCKYLKMRL